MDLALRRNITCLAPKYLLLGIGLSFICHSCWSFVNRIRSVIPHSGSRSAMVMSWWSQ